MYWVGTEEILVTDFLRHTSQWVVSTKKNCPVPLKLSVQSGVFILKPCTFFNCLWLKIFLSDIKAGCNIFFKAVKETEINQSYVRTVN